MADPAAVVVVGVFLAKEGEEDRALEALSETIRATHEEEGCLSYALHRDRSDPRRVVLVERWRSQEDLDAHFTKPYVAALMGVAGEVLAEPPGLWFTEPVPVGDPAKGVL